MDEDRPVSNLPYDESVDVSDAEDVPTALSVTPRARPRRQDLSHCSDEEEKDEEEDDEDDDDIQTGHPYRYAHAQKPDPVVPAAQKKIMGGMLDDDEESTEEEEEDGEQGGVFEGGYNPVDFENLNVSHDIKDLFQYITRYTPQQPNSDVNPYFPLPVMDEDRPVSNLPYDESVDVSDAEDVPTALSVTPRARPMRQDLSHCSDEEEKDEEEDDEDDDDIQTGHPYRYAHAQKPDPVVPAAQKKIMGGMLDDDEESTEEEEEDGEQGGVFEGGYNPVDFENLNVSHDIKDLFQYITRYTPQQVELDHKLKPFIPDFIPAVGDIDAFITVPRPDGQVNKLGLACIDEPCAKQSDPTVLDLQIRAITKQSTARAMQVSSIENAEKNPKAIESWIKNISELHRQKPPPAVHYSKNMPDIDILMQEWPTEMEDLLSRIKLPSAEMDCELGEYVDIICSILDIPIYQNRIHSLHLLFTLFSEFKNSQHFQKINQVAGEEEPER
eukprot:sb/3464098/